MIILLLLHFSYCQLNPMKRPKPTTQHILSDFPALCVTLSPKTEHISRLQICAFIFFKEKGKIKHNFPIFIKQTNPFLHSGHYSGQLFKIYFLVYAWILMEQLNISHHSGCQCLIPYTNTHWSCSVSECNTHFSKPRWLTDCQKCFPAQEYLARPSIVGDPCR